MASMADTFTAVDLSRLPAPSVVETLNYEAIYAELLESLQALVPDFTATVESDPAVKLLQVVAYREMLLRAHINDSARQVMLAFATGTNLDQLAALFGVARLLIAAADPDEGTEAVYESDDDLRSRVLLAPEALSVAGPEGAYIFHARSASGDVLDASATSPNPGDVLVSILSRIGTGAASAGLIATVDAYLSADMRRPLTDHVIVASAQIVDYVVTASVKTFVGPDSAIVMAASRARLDDYIARSHRIGRDITRAGLIAAIGGVEGVQNVTLTAPAADLVISRTQAARCTAVNLTYGGTAE